MNLGFLPQCGVVGGSGDVHMGVSMASAGSRESSHLSGCYYLPFASSKLIVCEAVSLLFVYVVGWGGSGLGRELPKTLHGGHRSLER